jgi:2-oxoisovalerate dehydrogenase E1 component
MREELLSRVEAYRRMATIRRFEERLLELSAEGLIAGSIHLCLGQEAIPVGALAALAGQDRVLSTYRGHGWALASGVPPAELMAEVCQRSGGVNGGRGGSAHLSAARYGFLGENSIVGAGVPIAAGVAMAARAQGTDRVVAVSIGEGAMNQGSVHEALVFAAAQALPVVVICENNGWSEMTRSAAVVRREHFADRAAAYGIPGRVVDGCDPLAVRDAVAQAAAEARAGEGPILLECKTVRLSGHYNRDIEHYRPKADAEDARAREPLGRLRRELLESGEAQVAALDAADAETAALVDAATEQVRAMPEPDPASAREHVYAAPDPGAQPAVLDAPAGGEELTYVKAVTAALRAELAARAEVLLYGEDVGVAGGIFGASRGLQEEFGEGRVFDTPIAESAILGSAVGAAMEGMRPIVEIMWGDFLLVALDQLFNQAANVRYVSRSQLTAPLVVRTQQGVTPGSCAQHSQSLEALLAHIPGLRVGLAATPQDAYAMLRAAVADPDPCIVIESRALYQSSGGVRLDAPVESAAGARRHRRGTDLAIVTWGALLGPSLEAAAELAAGGIDAAVLDLRWLSPIDDAAIAAVLEEAGGRVVVVHEANVSGGFGAEVAARIQERHFDELDAPVVRVGAPDVRIPSAPSLQRALVPDAAAIVAAARGVFGVAQRSMPALAG